MASIPVTQIRPLGFLWETTDPYLFCAHHKDYFPAGNDRFGPASGLTGRNMGQDFTLKDGFRMYHGLTVPGFPSHPHRGFETVTIVLNGFVDHSDSHGASGRYGNGDVQWMTAGSGLQHAEMFPLLHKDQPNPAELFQVWLNLPASRKFAAPLYKMLWAEEIPLIREKDAAGKKVEIRIIAGHYGPAMALDPAPDSWASDPENEVAIWLITLEAGAQWTIPAVNGKVSRMLYHYEGSGMTVAGHSLPGYHCCRLAPDQKLTVVNGNSEGRFLILQGKPIGEPVVQYGPFVMNSEEEIREAFRDYRATQFGGWPWDRSDPVHGPELKRFARFADGSSSEPNW
jgi:redox-sensitive bicupin YhaK (pirin superfamily)